MEVYWDVHEQWEGVLLKQGEINLAKILFQDTEIVRIGGIVLGAAAGIRAIAVYLGLGALLDISTGGGDDPPAPIDVTAINMNLSYARNDLNSLSSPITLEITNLTTTTSILIYIYLDQLVFQF